MEFFKPGTNINFVGKSRICLLLSAILIVASFALFFFVGPKYGIDFAGGVEVKIEFKEDPGIGKIRSSLTGLKNIRGLEVQRFVIPNKHVYTVKALGRIETAQLTEELSDVASIIFKHLQKEFGQDNVSIVSTDMVGPKVGAELRAKALWAIIASLIAMLIYIGFRFDFRFAPGAIIALAHDVIITTGFLIALGREFSLTVVASLLTLAGYSINDTIVVFDRIREGKTKYAKLTIEERVNRSINETLSRTVLTSLLTLFAVVALLIFGGAVIRDFSIAFTFGIVIGTYSSIFVASPIYIFLEKYYAARAKRLGRK